MTQPLDLTAGPNGQQMQDLITYLQERRRETLRVLRQCTDANADYWRWQGHAEMARQLLTRLGAEVPQ